MKKRIAIAVTVILTSMVLFVSCIAGSVTGSGNLTTKTFDYSDFTKIEAHYGFQVELTKSSTYSIKITADDNVHEYIYVRKSGETLEIGLKALGNYTSVTLEATITMPSLYELNLTGGSGADISGFSSSHDLSADLSGGSQLSGDIVSGDVDFNLSGGSKVALSGSASDMKINSSGGSQVELETYPVDNADIEISGGGRAVVNVSGTLDVNLSGGSHVSYSGNPDIGDVNLSGGSSINKK